MQHISASQIKLFLSCGRKWFMRYCQDREKAPESDAQAFGHKFHAEVEAAILGEYADLDEYMTPAQRTRLVNYMRMLDANRWLGQPGTLIEHPLHDISLEWYEGHRSTPSLVNLVIGEVPVAGFIDVLVPGRGILDHKTCGNGRSVKTPEELRNDPQMIIYAHAYFQAFPLELECEVAHGYFMKNPRKADGLGVDMTSVVLGRAEVERAFNQTIVPAVVSMLRLHDMDPEHNDVGCDTGACYQYGPCEYGPKGSGECIQDAMPLNLPAVMAPIPDFNPRLPKR